jgi:hypothetical protein
MELCYLDTPNYSFIKEESNPILNFGINGNDNCNSYDNTSNLNPMVIINTYNNLKEQLNKHKDSFERLEEQRIKFQVYQNKLIINHAEIVNICSVNESYEESKEDLEIRKATEEFIDYEAKMKEIYNNWLKNYYNPTILKLNNNIDELELRICNFRKLFIMTVNEITNTTDILNKKLCPICFTNEVDMCAYPCGHTCCNNCVLSHRTTNYTNSKKCISCRNSIDTYIKIFFLI